MAKQSADLMRLVAYIQEQPEGAKVLYKQAEQDTGIKMDGNGRSMLRQAILDAEPKREYKNLRNEGYLLDSVEIATEITTIHIKRIYTRVLRARRGVRVLRPKHYDMLPANEKAYMDLTSSVIETMAAAAEQRKLEKPKISQIKQTAEKIEIPDI